MIQFNPSAVIPALSQHLHDTKHQYGWMLDKPLPGGVMEMSFLIGSLPYLATWLLPFAGAVTVLEPKELQEHLRDLAKRAYDYYYVPKP